MGTRRMAKLETMNFNGRVAELVDATEASVLGFDSPVMAAARASSEHCWFESSSSHLFKTRGRAGRAPDKDELHVP